MLIKSSSRTHTLCRYGGTIDGKQVQSRITTVPVGTAPDAVPEEVAANLTPNELRELVAFLAKEHADTTRKRVHELVTRIEDVTRSLTPEVVDMATAEKLASALSEASAALRRVRRQQQPTSTMGAPPIS